MRDHQSGVMTEDGFGSPDAAATNTFPAEHCSVVAARTQGDHAYVLLNTGPTDRPYLYGVNCIRERGRWFEGVSGNGPGWAHADSDPDIGTLSCWSHVPAGVDRVRIDFDGAVIEAPVQNGAYLLVWFRVPCPGQWPRLVAIRSGGRWEPESDWGLAMRVSAERAIRRGRA